MSRRSRRSDTERRFGSSQRQAAVYAAAQANSKFSRLRAPQPNYPRGFAPRTPRQSHSLALRPLAPCAWLASRRSFVSYFGRFRTSLVSARCSAQWSELIRARRVPRMKPDRVRSFSAGTGSVGRSDFRATPIPVLLTSLILGVYYCAAFRSSSCIACAATTSRASPLRIRGGGQVLSTALAEVPVVRRE